MAKATPKPATAASGDQFNVPLVGYPDFAFLESMRTLLVLGAGRSSGGLIGYLLEKSSVCDWKVIVGDKAPGAAAAAIANHQNGEAVLFDPDDAERSLSLIAQADVVISLLPASFHFAAAKLCLTARKHLLTPSYVTNEMKSLHAAAKKDGLLFLNECGLDPGIDHMSAMHMLDEIRSKGGHVLSFESFTGGLIAPVEDPDNPWRYKFTWSPHNVVTAGQDGEAEYLLNGVRQHVGYQKLFCTTTSFDIPHLGELEGYPNRDSLKYMSVYGLDDVETMIRGTLRFKGFCSAWNVLVQLGCCNDTEELRGIASLTHRDFMEMFLGRGELPVEERLARYTGIAVNGHEMECLRRSGFFSTELVGLESGTPAQVLEHILMKKWQLKKGERDMVVMLHRVGYALGAGRHIRQDCMTMMGSESQTAMAITVGLPLGIAARLLLDGKIQARGVVIPLGKEFYEPILRELATRGVAFTSQTDDPLLK